MLLPLSQMETRDLLKFPSRAIVVWNTDALGLGRVKVIIPGVLEGVVADLPWFYRWNDPSSGVEKRPPEIDQEVIVEFPYNDIYHGFYTGVFESVANTSGETRNLGTAKSINKDSFGNREETNVATGEKSWLHQSGSQIRFDGAGNIIIDAKKNLTLKTQSGVSITLDAVSGQIIKSEVGKEDQGGTEKTVVTSGKRSLDVGSYDIKTAGSYTASVEGGYKLKTGNSSNSVIGNYSIAVGGTTSMLHAQLVDVTYGLGINMKIVAGPYSINLLTGAYTINVPAGVISFTGTSIALTGASLVNVAAPLITLGKGISPVISFLSDPIEDFITGRPKLGIATILVG